MFEKLDIIIPQYKEKEAQIKPLLNSIENQVGIDLNKYISVTIVNDHSDTKLSADFLRSFSFPITYLETPQNGGPGEARQWGIDHTSNPLIMFCDADDRFYDCAAFINLFNSMINNNCNGQWTMLFSNFYEEQIDDKSGYNLIPHDKPTNIWLHGKIFRRSFLEKNNIRFIPGLRGFEDTYFGNLAALLSSDTGKLHCRYFTYLWCKNPNSVTAQWSHDNKDYLYWNCNDFLVCHSTLIKKMAAIKPIPHSICDMILVDLYFAFFISQLREFDDGSEESEKRRNVYVNFIYDTINTYADIIGMFKQNVIISYYMYVKKDVYKYGLIMEKITWNQFLDEAISSGKIPASASVLKIENLLPDTKLKITVK